MLYHYKGWDSKCQGEFRKEFHQFSRVNSDIFQQKKACFFLEKWLTSDMGMCYVLSVSIGKIRDGGSRMRRENNLGTDSMAGLVVRLAIPAMLAQFINVL